MGFIQALSYYLTWGPVGERYLLVGADFPRFGGM